MADNLNYFPQAFLVWSHAFDPDEEGSLKKSNISSKNAKIAKFVGKYKPQAAVSKMFGRIHGQAYDRNFLNLENYKLSALVPEIRIYRLKDQQYVPFYFPVASDYKFQGSDKTQFNSSRSFSGGGVVIENFTITNTSQNAYTFRVKSITASLTIKLDNISRLFEGHPTGFAPLMELFTFTTATPSTSALLSGQHPRIAVSLGYNVPPGDIFDGQERKIINKSRIHSILSYQNHNFNIEADGTSRITINYVGYLEEVSSDEQLDALLPPESKLASANARAKLRGDMTISALGKNTKKSTTKQAKKESEDELKERKRNDIYAIQSQCAQIIEALEESGKIHSVPFDSGFFEKKQVQVEEVLDGASTAEAPTGIGDFYASLDQNRIHYITFGDLLDQWIEKIFKDFNINIAKRKKKKQKQEDISKSKDDAKNNITIITCDYSVQKNVDDKKSKKAGKSNSNAKYGNISDIPVSVDTFYSAIFDHTVRRGKYSMDLRYFLDVFCPSLLNSSMDEFTGFQAGVIKSINFAQTSFSAQRLRGNNREITENNFPDPTQFVPNGQANTNFFIFHQSSDRTSASPGDGDKSSDLEEGIYHLHPNKDRGLVTAINFQMKSPSGFKEWATARDGQPTAELRMPHNATVEMYANSLFLPGSVIYIDPNTIGFGAGSLTDLGSAARKLGLGGYYTCQDITTTLNSSGEMKTTLNLTFEDFPATSDNPVRSKERVKSMTDLRKLRRS